MVTAAGSRRQGSLKPLGGSKVVSGLGLVPGQRPRTHATNLVGRPAGKVAPAAASMAVRQLLAPSCGTALRGPGGRQPPQLLQLQSARPRRCAACCLGRRHPLGLRRPSVRVRLPGQRRRLELSRGGCSQQHVGLLGGLGGESRGGECQQWVGEELFEAQPVGRVNLIKMMVDQPSLC